MATQIHSKGTLSPLPAIETFGAAVKVRPREHKRTIDTWPLAAYIASIGGVMDAVLLIGVALHMSIGALIVSDCTAGALVGGLLFSILDIRRSKEQ